MPAAPVPPSPPSPLPFFVYGTLRPGQYHHDLFLRGRTKAEVRALLPGALLYEGPGYPYAVLDAGAVRPVVGELVEADPASYDEVRTALDLLEGYEPGNPDNLYDRLTADVTTTGADGRPVTARAWVYVAADRIARPLRTSGTPIVSGDWLTRN